MPTAKRQILPHVLNVLFGGCALLFIYSFLIVSKSLFRVELLRVTFVFSVLESVMFFFQVIYYFFRPDDKNRLWFLLLLLLFIVFNLVAGNLPNNSIALSTVAQYMISHAAGFSLGMYFPFYLYKACDLTYMRKHAYYGVFRYLLIPYIVFFLIAYPIVQDIVLIKRIGLFVPFIYSMTMYYAITKSVVEKWRTNREKGLVLEIICIYLAATLWTSLIIVNVFAWNKIYSVLGTNLGLMVMAFMFIRKTIIQSRLEYQQLIDLNNDLTIKVAQRTQELEELYASRTNNFINLVHETKTPLTLIKNYLEDYIAKRGEDKDIRIIKNGISKLTRDVTSIFEIERFLKGFSNYNNEQVTNFSEVLAEVVELFTIYASKKDIVLKASIAPNICINADPIAINRIINNLIENAIKYSFPDSTVIVHLQIVNSSIEFSVSDNGPGIPVLYHKKVFEPYFQISQDKSNNQGMGLGLPLVKQVVDQLGGKIILESNPSLSVGTHIKVQLPCLAETSSLINIGSTQVIYEEQEVPVLPELPYNEKLDSILLVEDNVEMVSYMIAKFQDRYNVFYAFNGDEGLKQLASLQALPDIIITDVQMDCLDGFSFVESLSRSNRYNHIPVIFLSAKSTAEDRLRGLRLGAIDFIQKPFSYEELSLKIDSILENIASQHKAILSQTISQLKFSKPDLADTLVEESTFEENLIRYNFTKTEMAVSRLIRTGMSASEVAEKLCNSVRTINNHLSSIYRKLNVTSKDAMLKKLES